MESRESGPKYHCFILFLPMIYFVDPPTVFLPTLGKESHLSFFSSKLSVRVKTDDNFQAGHGCCFWNTGRCKLDHSGSRPEYLQRG